MCTACGGDPEWEEASGRGTVYTFTVIRQHGAKPFRDELPYVVAMIKLEEGPMMMGNITGCAVDDVTVGMPVRAYVVRSRPAGRCRSGAGRRPGLDLGIRRLLSRSHPVNCPPGGPIQERMGADDPVVVTVEALNQQVATLTAQVRTATAELEMVRGMQHLIATRCARR